MESGSHLALPFPSLAWIAPLSTVVGHTAGKWPCGLSSSSVAESYRLLREGCGQVQEESGQAGSLPACRSPNSHVGCCPCDLSGVLRSHDALTA